MECLICKINFNNTRSLSSHIIKHNINSKQYYDKYFKKDNEGFCLNCGKETKFINLTRGYSKHCCNSCNCKSKSSLDKRKITNLNKYGTEFAQQSDEVKLNFKNNYYKKTGYCSPMQNPEVLKKLENNNIEKYGYKNNFEDPDFMIKSKNTKLIRYGDETYNNQEKLKRTCLKKYGTDHIFKLKNIQENNRIKIIKRVFNNLFESKFSKLIKPLFKLEDYKNVITNYKFQCIKCNNIFESNLDDGKIPRCLNCYPINTETSKYEDEIIKYLKSLNITNIIKNDRLQISPLELDIFLPDYNLAIEFDGLYWHSELSGKNKNYHLNKTSLCKEKNIRLLHIFEDEWLNKREIVENRLKYILSVDNSKKIFARKCVIRQIDNKEKDNFLNVNHIQGNDISSIRYGAFYNNELVAVMTFTQGRISSRIKAIKNEYELSRFATSKNVVGIASKLLKHFMDDYKPSKISTYADLRWSNGNLYEKLGMKLVRQTKPNYWYIIKNSREHRFNWRKSELIKKLQIFDNNLTEWQNMQLNGYNRIWDCGNLKYELIK